MDFCIWANRSKDAAASPWEGREGGAHFLKKEAGLLSYDPFSPRPFIKSVEMALGDFPAEGGGSNPHLALGVTSQCISQGLGEKNGTERESTSGLLGAFVRFALAEEKRKKNLLSRAGNRRQTRANPISANPRVTFFVVTAHSLSGKEREGEEEEEENSPKFELEKDSERSEGEEEGGEGARREITSRI